VVLIDPALTASVPPRLTAIVGLDALCQAVESFWAVNATERSRSCAEQAIRLVLEHLAECVHDPKSESRRAMCLAAHLAGSAIDVSKTTACHAISYPLTFQFGIPHGHAVALTLGETLLFNSGVTDGDIADPRGVPYVRATINRLGLLLGCSSPRESRAKIHALIKEIGLETRLSDLGVAEAADRELIARNADPERLSNNPRVMTRRDALRILDSVA
jgi:alcohol dehydrogenase class IV